MSAPLPIAEILPEAERGPFLDVIEEAIGLGTFVWDLARGRSAWSPGFFRLLGLEPVPVPTATFFDRVHPDDRARAMMAWEHIAVQGRIDPLEYRILRGDEVRWVIGRGTVTRDASGAVDRVIGTIIDVTASRASREQLAEALELLTEIQRAAGVGSHVYELRTGRLTWSDELYRILGVAPGTPIVEDLYARLTHPEDRARQYEWGRRVAAGEVMPPFLGRMIRPDGTLRYLETRARRVDRPSGPAILGVSLDVTARVELEQDLRHAAKMEAVGTLAAGVAHDFNNYLTVLSMQIEAVRLTMKPTTDDLATMSDAVARCAALVQQLLAFARRQPFRPRRIDLAEGARGVVRLFRRAAAPELDVEVHGAGALPVHGDAAQLDGAVMNLLINARDAMPDGGRVVVELGPVELAAGDPRLEDRLAPGTYARVRVTDNGHGIPADVLPRIFEPYFTTKAAGGSSGLGLAAVYGTVMQHGGAIDVTSEPGRGATFDVYLPVDERPVAAAPPPVTPAPAASLRILVVEDVEPVRTAIATLLRQDGHQVVESPDGADALARVRAGEPFDVVLSDVVMPQLDGRGLARALAADAPGQPVILMTGYTDRLGDEAAIRLDKPFSREELQAALARARAAHRES